MFRAYESFKLVGGGVGADRSKLAVVLNCVHESNTATPDASCLINAHGPVLGGTVSSIS